MRLCDVAPDGSSTLVTRRVLNLTHRESHERPSPLVPGEAVAATVELTAIAHSFPPGHRIRLAVSPTYWPWAWPSPVTAELTFALRECSLELPVRPRPAREPAIEFAEPEWAPGVEVVSYAPTPSRRVIARDVAAGRLTITTDFSYFGHQTYRNGLEYREDMRDSEAITIGDPLSAEVRCERTIRMRQARLEHPRRGLGDDVVDGRRLHRHERHRRVRGRGSRRRQAVDAGDPSRSRLNRPGKRIAR